MRIDHASSAWFSGASSHSLSRFRLPVLGGDEGRAEVAAAVDHLEEAAVVTLAGGEVGVHEVGVSGEGGDGQPGAVVGRDVLAAGVGVERAVGRAKLDVGEPGLADEAGLLRRFGSKDVAEDANGIH